MWPLKSSYQRLITLSGPQSGIRSVSFSPDGLFVSAVGYGGVTIWDLRTSAWIYFEGTHKHVFVFGNMAGEMFLWLWDSVHKPKSPPGHQVNIVTSTSNGVVAVWSLTANLELKNAFLADMPDDILPRTVKFSNGGQVFVFSRDGGSFLQLDGETGSRCLWMKSKICFAAWIGPNAAMFKLSNSEFVREFKGDEMLFPNAKEVAFAEEGSLLVVGSDHGPVQIFSVLSGQRLQHLTFPRTATLQYVSCHLIAIASSGKDRPADVLIYKKNCTALRSLSQTKDDANLAFRIGVTWNALRWIGFAIISLVALYFALFSYWTAFTLGVEASVFPLGLGWRGFIYISALSRFSDLQYNMPRTSTITTTSTEYHTDFLIEYLTDFLTSTTPTS
ncbi:hypothetical protein D9758_014002 [Tetrapyrgos nigripes]|uniref:Uncharacterized protein n=1 Tax=Tetrapyrgos nigripes TaxID=182062 RepID=A0A8H5G7T1_9AGAR|nr:hypothetical protein D9758_014002 [Tetrapyrgos nigripes]